jgi:hypothetical protein
MSSSGGKGQNRRGLSQNLVNDQGYAISEYRRYVHCGNLRCKKCRNGPSHGPYLYERFRDETGRTHTKYRGRA